MSKEETQFIKWLARIGAVIIATMVIGLFSFYSMTIRFESATDVRIHQVEKAVDEIRADIKEIKDDI